MKNVVSHEMSIWTVEMKAYLEFGNDLTIYIIREMMEKDTKQIPEEWNLLTENYKLAHLFEIETTTKRLLVLTKMPRCKTSDKMPFYRMFIDAGFTSNELQKLGIDIEWDIGGFLVVHQFMYSGDKKPINPPVDADAQAIIFYVMIHKGPKIKIEAFVVPITHLDWLKPYKSRNNTHKFIFEFFTNLLHLMNDPQVKTTYIERDEKRNRKREQKGKVPIPARNIIKVTGTLKNYINKLESDGDIWHYSHRFWVRGHFKHWKSQRYVNMQGKRTWIPPFVKGEGILIKKEYEVKAGE